MRILPLKALRPFKPLKPLKKDRRDARPEVSVKLSCAACGQHVTLTYRPSDDTETCEWTCPFAGCRQVQKIDLPGSLIRVVAWG